MFVGHYFAAPIGAAKGRIKLWHGFVAVQLVDFAWAIFILLGIEKGRVVPGFTEASPLDLHHMPYTHSLLFSFIWAVLGASAFKVLTKAKDWLGAMIFGLLVLSHWFADLLVHVPDLMLWPGSDKYGLGLWRQIEISLPLELGVFAAGMIYYLAKTKPTGQRARLWAILFIAVLTAFQVLPNLGPPPRSITEMAITALVGYTVLAVFAARFERTRSISVS